MPRLYEYLRVNRRECPAGRQLLLVQLSLVQRLYEWMRADRNDRRHCPHQMTVNHLALMGPMELTEQMEQTERTERTVLPEHTALLERLVQTVRMALAER
jgi:hypothetical protein